MTKENTQKTTKVPEKRCGGGCPNTNGGGVGVSTNQDILQ
jgi:hypothetical protein